jgi:hypothetical protein
MYLCTCARSAHQQHLRPAYRKGTGPFAAALRPLGSFGVHLCPHSLPNPPARHCRPASTGHHAGAELVLCPSALVRHQSNQCHQIGPRRNPIHLLPKLPSARAQRRFLKSHDAQARCFMAGSDQLRLHSSSTLTPALS